MDDEIQPALPVETKTIDYRTPRKGMELALMHLQQRMGMTVVDDESNEFLIATKDDVTVFVWVYTRTTHAFGNPLHSLTVEKIQGYRKFAAERLARRHTSWPPKIRIDLISILLEDVPKLEHLTEVG